MNGRVVAVNVKVGDTVQPAYALVVLEAMKMEHALSVPAPARVKAVHVGKYVEIELDGSDREAARKALDEAAHRFLSNPVIENYRIEMLD